MLNIIIKNPFFFSLVDVDVIVHSSVIDTSILETMHHKFIADLSD
jgi:hypothetical protein